MELEREKDNERERKGIYYARNVPPQNLVNQSMWQKFCELFAHLRKMEK